MHDAFVISGDADSEWTSMGNLPSACYLFVHRHAKRQYAASCQIMHTHSEIVYTYLADRHMGSVHDFLFAVRPFL